MTQGPGVLPVSGDIDFWKMLGGGLLSYFVLKEGFMFMSKFIGRNSAGENAAIKALVDSLQKITETHDSRWSFMVEKLTSGQNAQAAATQGLAEVVSKLDKKMEGFIAACPAIPSDKK